MRDPRSTRPSRRGRPGRADVARHEDQREVAERTREVGPVRPPPHAVLVGESAGDPAEHLGVDGHHPDAFAKDLEAEPPASHVPDTDRIGGLITSLSTRARHEQLAALDTRPRLVLNPAGRAPAAVVSSSRSRATTAEPPGSATRVRHEWLTALLAGLVVWNLAALMEPSRQRRSWNQAANGVLARFRNRKARSGSALQQYRHGDSKQIG